MNLIHLETLHVNDSIRINALVRLLVCVPVFEEWRPAADELDSMCEEKSCAPKSLRE